MGFSNLDDALQEAMRHHQAGRLGDAERIYREILSANPNHASALHLLGTIAHQAGRSDVGVQMIEKAISLGLRNVEVFNSLGECYRFLNQYPKALQACQTALSLKPDHAETLSNLGLTLSALGRHGEALPLLEKAVRAAPGHAIAHHNYGVGLGSAGRHEDAIVQWEETLKIDPDHPHAMRDMGKALTWINRADEAVKVLAKLVAKYPQFAEGFADYSNALATAGRFDEAIAAAKRAVELAPDRAEAYNALGMVYMNAERYDEALAAMMKAVELNPRHHPALGNVGIVHFKLGHYSESAEWIDRAALIPQDNSDVYRSLFQLWYFNKRPDKALDVAERALHFQPENARNHFDRAVALLALGRLREGFEEYEWRWKCSDFSTPPYVFNKPIWDGSDPHNRTVFIYNEQGHGDDIQFARYIKLVAGMGAKIIVEVPDLLCPLIESLPEVSNVIPMGSDLPDFDLHISMASLPRVFKTTLETIPSTVPYLFADPKRIERWKPIIDGHAHGLKVGIVWAGRAKPDPRRSTTLRAMSVLADVANISWYSLQVGEQRTELKDAPPMKILDLGEDFRDFGDTAAALSQLDLVITIDTATAHLSGALGIRTWTMLMHAPDWRWMMEGDTTPWYPTMRLFRQQARNGWNTVMEQIRAELLKLVDSKVS